MTGTCPTTFSYWGGDDIPLKFDGAFTGGTHLKRGIGVTMLGPDSATGEVLNGRKGILFLSFKWDGAAGEVIFDVGGIKITRASDFIGDFRIRLNIRMVGGPEADITQTSSTYDPGEWGVLLVAWDMDEADTSKTVRVYINDSDENRTIIALTTSLDVNYRTTPNAIGVDRAVTTGEFFEGCIEKAYLNTTTWFDISVEANRRKFYNADLTPVDIGDDGSTPTGGVPTIFFSAGMTENLGDGGEFTLLGTVADCSNDPTDTPGDPGP